jgi:hypothetical protein
MARRFDHWIESYKIQPPVGRLYEYGAKPHVVEIGVAGGHQIQFQEHLGETEVEARTKAQSALDEWLSKQSAVDI